MRHRFLSLAALAAVGGACSSFGSAGADASSSQADAGANASLDGVPGGLTLTLPASVSLVLGRPTMLHASLKREGAATGIVQLDLVNAPPGLSGRLPAIVPGESEIDVELTAAAPLPQGELEIRLRASTGTWTSDVTIVAAVAGAPGTSDTTWKGVSITHHVQNLPEYQEFPVAAAVMSDGRFFTADNVVANDGSVTSSIVRYAKDGSPDTSLNGDGHVAFPSNVFVQEIGIAGDRLVVLHRGPGVTSLTEFTLDGQRYAGWGTNGTYTRATPAGSEGDDPAILTRAFVARASGEAAVLWGATITGAPYLLAEWVSANGAIDTTVNAKAQSTDTTAFELSSGVMDDTSLVAAGGSSVIRFSRSGGAMLSSFGTGGRTSILYASRLHQLTHDAKGRYLTSGQGSTLGEVVIARLTTDGKLDTSFAGFGYLRELGTGLAPFVIQQDGKIVQGWTTAGADPTDCVFARYLEDGTADSSFGAGGTARIASCRVLSLALQPDGRMLLNGGERRIWL